MSVASDDVIKARQAFQARNAAVVEETRRKILEVRRKAAERFEENAKIRKERLKQVTLNLSLTIEELRKGHEEVKARLSQAAVSRDVHVRVNRGLEALEDLVRVQRGTTLDQDRLLAALEDPTISGTNMDRKRRASASELIQSVQRTLVQQTEFINVAAHELRTPIMPILINAEMLQTESGENSAELDAIMRNALRLQRLADNILNVARIDSNSLRLRKEVLDLNVVLAEMVNDKVRTVGKVTLVFDPHEGPVHVSADTYRLEQVISNLIDNAVKFSKDGQVRIALTQNEGSARVDVVDDGPGIEPEIFPLLFSKFGARSHGGTGLGLFICKGIIEAHGGTIAASNNAPAKGAKFSFTLPLAAG